LMSKSPQHKFSTVREGHASASLNLCLCEQGEVKKRWGAQKIDWCGLIGLMYDT
jgi:hypothetical protein